MSGKHPLTTSEMQTFHYNNNNNNNKIFNIYREYRYIQAQMYKINQRLKTYMHQPSEHSSSAVGPSHKKYLFKKSIHRYFAYYIYIKPQITQNYTCRYVLHNW